MNLNIGTVIYELRKQKGITQEQLANVVGVSVPAISKWENGTSYPDITSLPIIARYFNTSIDELLSYEMELSKEELENFIKKCQELRHTEPFEIVVSECEKMLYQYPNNFDLKFRVGSLYMMGIPYQKNEASIKELSRKAIKLLEEATKSPDSKVVDQANYILASLYGVNGEEDKAIEILLNYPKSELNPDDLLIPMYVRQEKYKEAKELLQGHLFKSLHSIGLYLSSFQHIAMKEDKPELAERLLLMNEQLIQVFEVQSVFGMSHELGAANFYATAKDEVKTLDYLKQIVCNLLAHDEKAPKPEVFEFVNYHENNSMKHLAEVILRSFDLDPSYEFIEENDEFIKLKEQLKQFL